MVLNHGNVNTVHNHCAMMGHPAFPLLSRGPRTRPDQDGVRGTPLYLPHASHLFNGVRYWQGDRLQPSIIRAISRSNIDSLFSALSGADTAQGASKQPSSSRPVCLQGSSMFLVPTEWLWLDGVGVTSWGREMRPPPKTCPCTWKPREPSQSSSNAKLAADIS